MQNKTKTMLCAIIILTVIVPILTTDVFGESDDRLGKIDETLKLYTDKISTANSTESVEDYKKTIDRLNLARQWIILENQGRSDSDVANEVLIKLLNDMPKTAQMANNPPTEDFEYASSPSYKAYKTSSQSRTNCSTQGG